MSNSITVNLKELFSNKVFRIPHYQRGYSWEERQLSDLWDDINDISKDDDGYYISHYTGTLYLSETLKREIPETEIWAQDNQKFYDVVDGQQRLTSIVILLYELIRIAPDGLGQDSQEDLYKSFICLRHKNQRLKCYKFCYIENNRDYLIKDIFEDDTLTILPSEWENIYSRNLLFAKKFFRNKLQELKKTGFEYIEELYRKLTTALIFDQRIIEKDLDVQAVFETMNNRGKPLTTLEKLKNRLIYLTNRFSDRTEALTLQQQINKAWANIYTELAKNPQIILSEDVFLSAFLSVYRKPTDSSYTFSEAQAEEKVFQMFCNRAQRYGESDVDFGKINDFVIHLSAFSHAWYMIHATDDELIRRILILNGGKEVKIFLATLIALEASYKLDVNKCLTLTELILFRNSFPIETVLDYKVFANYARDIYAPKNVLPKVITKLEERFSMPYETSAFISGFRWLFSYTNGNKGYHRWGGLKYLLFCYEKHLKDDVYREYTDRVIWDDFFEVNIEHIIPQKYQTYWSDTVNSYLVGIPDDLQWRASVTLINSIGNLSIIKGRKNSELQNDPWEKKKDRYKTGCYSEQEVSEFCYWNPTTVFQRGKRIFRFIESRLPGLHFTDQELLDVIFANNTYYPVEFREPQENKTEQDGGY